MFYLLVIFIFLLSGVYFIVDPAPILGIYQVWGKWSWIKQWIIYLGIKYNKRKKTGAVGHKKAGYGLKANDDINTMELPQKLGEHPLAVDAVWFGGANKDGVYLVISGARRQDRIMQSMLFLYIPGVGLLQYPNHPETAIQQNESESEGWIGGGIHLEPVEPLRKWSVRYCGELINVCTKQLYRVDLDLVYNTNLKHFDFDSDMNPWTVARAMAREPWSQEYFARLRSAHQNHYEQFGSLTGTVDIDGEKQKIEIDVMKDHTHGSVRDWTLMHRYGFHQFTTQSGIRGFLGVVSQPGTLSVLELGWILRDGQPFPVQDVDFQIWNFGEGGEDTSDYGFRFQAGDVWYNVQVSLVHQEKGRAYYGHDWEARIVERFAKYKINGEDGWGVTEWEYRNKEGKIVKIED
ncbi:uncharacterized protein LOC111706873 [Eurytemora carolleeae]|uniref:uncharacterized protein LOC111706873 n=1 Tax=Eurytemora carolleeae TaxID=1294199 RepID=UPI000C780EB4|nr:uncharacterized protein LOC111706873 [Eurytemora carolleeae]|eukprot:XP_023335574.1 uncharacterized protein LOC111706873 [Eurytemora affinis]